MMAALDERVSDMSIYDAVGCVRAEIEGWNLLATPESELAVHRDADGPWIHLRVGRTEDFAIAA